MDVSMKREAVGGRRSMAVYVSGRCIRSGLSEAEALALMAAVLNGELARPGTA